MIPRSLLVGTDRTVLALSGAAVATILFALWNPGGATGDLHRAVVVLAGSLAALLLAWHRLQPPGPADLPRVGDRWLLVPFALVLSSAGLALLPLPPGLVAVLAPSTAGIHAAEAAAAGITPPWRPLSLEPIATLRAGLLCAAYLAFALALVPLARRASQARRLAWAVAGLGVLCTFLTLAGLADAHAPAQWRGRPTSPFLNPNHVCTFLALALGPTLGLLLVPLEGVPAASPGGVPALLARLSGGRGALSRRGLAGLAATLIVVGVLVTRSRAGALAAALAAALVIAPRLRRGQRWLAAVVVLVIGAGLWLGDPDPLRARLDEDAIRMDTLGGRIENWGVAGRVIAGAPLGGTGLATFRDASVAALSSQRVGNSRPGEAHNDYLELVSNLGLPLGALALLAAGWIVLLAARRAWDAPSRARAVAQGGWAGLMGALLQEGFDFGLQVPGPALLGLTALALAFAAPPPHDPPPTTPVPGPLRRALPPLLLGLALLAAGGPLLLQTKAEATGRAAFAVAVSPGVPAEQRAEVFHRAERALTPAAGPWARADVHWLRFTALDGAGDSGLSQDAERAARAAVAGAPGRAEYQAGLGVLLLNAWRRRARQERGEALLREGDARLALALELGPTTPSVLLTGAEWRLDRLARTGRAEEAEQARALLAAALAREPALRARVDALLTRRAASLGEREVELRQALLGSSR